MFLKHRNEFPRYLDYIGAKSVAEIGVGAGEFSRVLLQSNLDILYFIDHWHNPRDALAKQRAYEINDHRAVILEQSSESAAKLFADNSLDFVYIDAQHAYKHIKHDISLWLPKTKILAGHDYIDWNYAANAPCGVIQAVQELAAELGRPVNVVGDLSYRGTDHNHFPSWYVTK